MATTAAMRKERNASKKSNVVALDPMKQFRAEYAPKIEDAAFRYANGWQDCEGYLRALAGKGAVKSLADLLEVKTPFRIGIVRSGAGLSHDEAVLACNRAKKTDAVKRADAAFRQAWSRMLKKLGLDWAKFEPRGKGANQKRGAKKRKEETSTTAPKVTQAPKSETPEVNAKGLPIQAFAPAKASKPVDCRLFASDMRGLFLRYVNENAKDLEQPLRRLMEDFADGVKKLSESEWHVKASAPVQAAPKARTSRGK